MSSFNSIDFLLKDFGGYEDRAALIWKGQSVSYKDILQGIQRWGETLKDLKAGTIVALEGDFLLKRSPCSMH